jgi:hypothetical protein
MANPQMPNMQGAAAMTDTLDFVKNLWGSMNVPGMNIPGITTPTLSVEELDKKINDLKAVEAWLNVNMSMLRGTVQALEVQRATIVTLKSMGATLAAAVQQPGANDKSLFSSVPYASVFFQQPPAPAANKPEAAKPAAAKPAEPEAKQTEAKPPESGEPADSAAQMTNPVAWWNLLQEQFKQAVTTMSPDALANAAAMASEAATKFTAPAKAAPAPAEAKATAKQAAAAAAAKAAPKPAAAKPKAGKDAKS